MNRVIKFGVYFLIGVALFTIFTAALNGGGGGTAPNGTDPTASPATPTPVPERGDDYYKQEIADRLRNSNITVLSVGVENNVTTIRYVPRRPNESVIVEEMGTISIQYAALIQDGWNVSMLEAIAIPARNQTTDNSSRSTSPPTTNSTNQSDLNKTTEVNGSANNQNESRQPVAAWYVKTKWVKEMDGENSTEKYLKNILASIQMNSSAVESKTYHLQRWWFRHLKQPKSAPELGCMRILELAPHRQIG